MNSCLYAGTVRHLRKAPKVHDFSYRLFMMYLDLDELPELFDGHWLWSARRPAAAWFRRADYLGDPRTALADAVRDEAERQTGLRPEGPIRLLTHLRYFGLVMNPVSLYYCFEKHGDRVETVLAEVTNTPWKERHTYAIGQGPHAEVTGRSHHLEKAFHVSPFMDMAHQYKWHFGVPNERLRVRMENTQAGKSVFVASLKLEREAITHKSLRKALVQHPCMTARVAAAIYWQAARLRLKGVPFYPHPAKSVS